MLLPTQSVQVQVPQTIKHHLHQAAANWKEYWAVDGPKGIRWVIFPFYQRADKAFGSKTGGLNELKITC